LPGFNVQGAAAGGETAEARQKAIESGRLCATAYKELLDHVNLVSAKSLLSDL